MTDVLPTGWQFLPLPGNGNLVFVDAPGTATSSAGGHPVYGPFADPPPGGNFVQADGNPDFESIFYQAISGLQAETIYDLSFWQRRDSRWAFPVPRPSSGLCSSGTPIRA